MLWIDTREPKKVQDLMKAAAREAGDTSGLQYLESADFAIGDQDGCTLGIERKTWSDLLSSMRDGRLKRQIPRMLERYQPSVLLVEGRYAVTDTGKMLINQSIGASGWTHLAVQLYLLGIQKSGVWVIHTVGKVCTADVIRGLCERAKGGCVVDSQREMRAKRKQAK